ncbi:MarR family winged helix-turn-helix transcriptional regulator [Nocardioides lijunqiniae]|uniref:MarR family winged helix-turn-helix transcriptional regulator n=1 Tax=Nocardioides lijunqiniae TaxID=2760832 RepID=UPI00187878F7|nr:MarR family transcriptional regulator [Nocardioides lijunqiniae]
MSSDHQEPDHVGRIMAQWAVERPEVDVSPQGVIGRLHRLAVLLDEELRPVFAAAGLSDGDFDVLAALRRAGAPYELSPGQIAQTTMVTSGAVTKRLDRLEGAGLVLRQTSEDDGRGRRVRLTGRGRELVDGTFERHMANERRLVSLLDEPDRRELARLLEAWGRALDA